MNAGASGSEVCQSVVEVTYITEEGEIEVLPRAAIDFSYRHSSFQKRRGAIGGAVFRLTPSESARPTQLQIIEYRTRTQPYGDKSAGCVFRNPLGGSAGALIEQSGLKGMRIGDAEVSLLHANFLVNRGSATAEEMLELVAVVKRVVKEKTGVDLEMEVRCIPYVSS
jgi:UDP-N-acetylmuramate dehydrogenase